MKKRNYNFVREAFHVRRYHTVLHVNKEETVAHHTCNVIAILFELYDDAPPLDLIKLALHHDVPELVTGDIPATAKWEFPKFAEQAVLVEEEIKKEAGLFDPKLEEIDQVLFKFADMFDLCLKCVEEMATGNLLFARVLANGLSFLRKQLNGPLKNHIPANELFLMIENNPFILIEEVENEQRQNATRVH